MRIYWCILFIVFYSSTKGDTLVIHNDFASEYLGRYAEFIIAPRGSRVEEIARSNLWTKSERDVLNFGSTENSIWLKFHIQNNTNIFQNIVINLSNPYLDIVKVYKYGLPQPISEGGDCTEAPKNVSKSAFFATGLILKPQESTTYMIKVYGNENITLPFKVESQTSAMITSNQRRFIFGSYTGIFTLVGVMTLILYVIIRHEVFIYYFVYLVCVYFAQIFTSIDNTSYLNLVHPFNDLKLYIAITAVGPAALQFVSKFLSINAKTKAHVGLFNKFSLLYVSIPIVYLILGQIWAFRIVNALNFFGCFLVINYAFNHYQPSRRDVKVLLSAWIVFLIGIMLYTLMNVNVLKYSMLNHYLMPVGSAIETLLLATALGIKVKQLEVDLAIASGRIDQLDESISKIEKSSNKNILHATTQFFQPHFVYNLLTSVNNGIRMGYTFKTQQMVNQAAALIRKGLNFSNEMFITVEDECTFLQEYFELESLKSRFNLELVTHIDSDIIEGNIQIPPLLTQVYVENAIKHALTSNSCKLRCDFKFLDADTLICRIEDWGIGLTSAERYGRQRLRKRIYGSRIIRKRVNVLRSIGYRVDVNIQNKSEINNEETGVVVEIRYPIDITPLKEYV